MHGTMRDKSSAIFGIVLLGLLAFQLTLAFSFGGRSACPNWVSFEGEREFHPWDGRKIEEKIGSCNSILHMCWMEWFGVTFVSTRRLAVSKSQNLLFKYVP